MVTTDASTRLGRVFDRLPSGTGWVSLQLRILFLDAQKLKRRFHFHCSQVSWVSLVFEFGILFDCCPGSVHS